MRQTNFLYDILVLMYQISWKSSHFATFLAKIDDYLSDVQLKTIRYGKTQWKVIFCGQNEGSANLERPFVPEILTYGYFHWSQYRKNVFFSWKWLAHPEKCIFFENFFFSCRVMMFNTIKNWGEQYCTIFNFSTFIQPTPNTNRTANCFNYCWFHPVLCFGRDSRFNGIFCVFRFNMWNI